MMNLTPLPSWPRRPMASRAGWLLLILALMPVAAIGKRIYQYRDANGVLHFTDKRPDDPKLEVKETKVRVDPQQWIELLVTESGREHVVTLINRVGGHAMVNLAFKQQDNMRAEPPLPLAVTLGAYENRQVARIQQADPTRPGQFGISYTAIPGRPLRLTASTYQYRYPFARRDQSSLGQGFNGSFSHTDLQSRYAVDLGVAEGTPVLAARAGRVMLVEEDFEGAGLDRQRYGERANSVRIEHEDGTMAVYAHLAFESVVVSGGQHVKAGQMLGAAGNTGFSTGPHLHFAVQINDGQELHSIPFEFEGGMPAPAMGAPDPAN